MAAGGLPVVRLAGEITPQRLRTALVRDPVARQAFGQAAAEAGRTNLTGEAQAGGRQAAPATLGEPGTPAATSAAVPRACLAAATAKAGRQLVPAFVAEGRYQRRPATVLVTSAAAEPNRAELWVFPSGDCSGPPLATQRIE